MSNEEQAALTPETGAGPERPGNPALRAWALVAVVITTATVGFLALGSGAPVEEAPRPTWSNTPMSAPMPSAAPMLIEEPAASSLSTDLVVCASTPVELLVAEASASGGVFSPGEAPLRDLSAVWRWEMAGIGELVVVTVDTDGIDPSAVAMLEAPGAVDALGGAGGVVDRVATAVSGRWWVGIGTAFDIGTPLPSRTISDAATMIAACMNGEAPVEVLGSR